jgi:hypothetical protein
MKTKIKHIGCLLFLVISFVACKSTVTNTYKVSKISHVTATTALKSWNNYIATHAVSIEKEIAVQHVYDKYRLAQEALLKSTINSVTNSVGTGSFDKAIADTSYALTELLNLLTSYGVNLNTP